MLLLHRIIGQCSNERNCKLETARLVPDRRACDFPKQGWRITRYRNNLHSLRDTCVKACSKRHMM
jgi:hypothetical protein